MTVMVNIRLDPRMRDALKKAADEQFSGMSAIIKKACQEYLDKRGIKWRESESQKGKPPRKKKPNLQP